MRVIKQNPTKTKENDENEKETILTLESLDFVY